MRRVRVQKTIIFQHLGSQVDCLVWLRTHCNKAVREISLHAKERTRALSYVESALWQQPTRLSGSLAAAQWVCHFHSRTLALWKSHLSGQPTLEGRLLPLFALFQSSPTIQAPEYFHKCLMQSWRSGQLEPHSKQCR